MNYFKKKPELKLTCQMLEAYEAHLRQEELSEHTILKYVHDLQRLSSYIKDESLTKEQLMSWKEKLIDSYAPASVNSMLAAINSFVTWLGHPELKVKLLKIQRALFFKPEKELTQEEYVRLVNAANRSGNERLSLVIQTICATGIRVSELKYITVESVRTGRAEVNCKGKRRTVLIPEKLCRILLKYIHKKNRSGGCVFITKNGNPLDRSNIWREMKSLCEEARVEQGKVYPHNLRHLFARTYYRLEKDLSRLADLLGHTSVNTTRIYTAESGLIHSRQIERMNLIIT